MLRNAKQKKKNASEGFEPSPPGHEPEVQLPSHLLANI